MQLLDHDQLRETLIATAHEAGELIQETFGHPTFVQAKPGHHDYVTEADLAAERLIRSRLSEAYSNLAIVGEEGGGSPNAPYVAYVDPIDGTANFICGIPFYCVSIGVAMEGKLIAGVVHDPERRETFTVSDRRALLNGAPISAGSCVSDDQATISMTWPYESTKVDSNATSTFVDALESFRSVRRLGSAALGLAYVASGRIDAASELEAKPWDVAAGFALVQAAGGRITRTAAPGPLDAMDWFSPAYVAHGDSFRIESSSISRLFN